MGPEITASQKVTYEPSIPSGGVTSNHGNVIRVSNFGQVLAFYNLSKHAEYYTYPKKVSEIRNTLTYWHLLHI